MADTVIVKRTENRLIVTKEDKKVTVAAPYVKNENNYTARLVILGYYDTLSDLTTAITSPSEGDPYGVGTEAPYTIYIWNGTEWKDNGTLKGEKGDPTKWIRGTVDPTTEGIDGDLYLNYTTWHVWEKISGTWEDKGTIKGADGADCAGTAFQEVAEKDQPGGYAGLDNNGALKSKIRSTPILDFNTATIGGFYYWGTSSLNAPLRGTGTALVIDRAHNAGLAQIAIELSTRILHIRFATNTSNTEWTDWKRLDETTWGSISGTLADQTDLQTALAGKANTSHSHSYAPIPSSSSLPVGMCCFCYNNATSDIANGETVAGSNLKIFRLSLRTTDSSPDDGSLILVESFISGSLSGTWKNITGTTVNKYYKPLGIATRHTGLFVRTA